MVIAAVHTDSQPLSGDWDGKHWDQQDARCSNNFLSGPTPPVPPPGAAGGLLWQIVGASDPDSVVFTVSVDLPIDDEIIFAGVRNNQVTGYLPTPSITDVGQDKITPYHNGMRWDEYYNRGLYIASVYGANEPFMINVLGATSQCTVVGAFHVHGGTQPVMINITGGGPSPLPAGAVPAETAGTPSRKQAGGKGEQTEARRSSGRKS
jgi:hypothetical protein